MVIWLPGLLKDAELIVLKAVTFESFTDGLRLPRYFYNGTYPE